MGKFEELREDLSKVNLLYVEDEADVRNATLEFFENIFPNIDSATNGQEGLTLFKEKKYAIVITDLKMPSMSGHEMICKIRDLDKDVVIIVMSALDSKFEDIDEAEWAGREDCEELSDAHLNKPVKFMEFIDTLESLRDKIFR